MKKLITAALLSVVLGCVEAEASTDVNMVISTPTYSGIRVTTGTAVRVDNRIQGNVFTIPSTRIGIEVQNLDSTYSVWCGYDSAVDTTTVTNARGNNIGKQIKAGDVVFIGLLRSVQYNCIAADGAGTASVWLHTENVYKE